MLSSLALLVLDVNADVVLVDVVIDVLEGSHGFEMNRRLSLGGIGIRLSVVGSLLDEVYLLVLLDVFVRVYR